MGETKIDKEISRKVRIIDGELCVSSAELMRIMGISTRTLSNWEGKGCPKAGRGFWNIKDVLEWRGLTKNGLKTADKAESNSVMSAKLEAEAALKTAQAEAAEFKNEIAKGVYLKKIDVVSDLRTFFVVLKRSMSAASRSLAAEVGQYLDPIQARRVEKRLNEKLNEILLQLSVDGVYDAKKGTKEKGTK